jgi:hypothetical protein
LMERESNASDYSQFFTMTTCTDVLDSESLRGYYSLYQPMVRVRLSCVVCLERATLLL